MRAIGQETGSKLSQSYLSQIESGARPHLTNTTRQILASFSRCIRDTWWTIPEGYHPELHERSAGPGGQAGCVAGVGSGAVSARSGVEELRC